MGTVKNILDSASLAKWSIDIFDSLNEGLLIADASGVIQYVNKQYLRIINKTKEEIMFQQIATVRPGALLPTVIKTGQGMNGVYRTDGRVEYIVDMSPIVVGGEIVGGVSIVRDITEARKLSEELGRARSRVIDLQGTVKGILSARYTFDDLVYSGSTFEACVRLAQKAALSDSNAVIQGESGTGKELMAQAIHNASARKHRPFVALNCAAIPANLLESELFGYTEGSFTGSKRGGKPGLLHLADGGTLFLDEIGDMGMDLQAKLLRVLQEKTVRKLGDFEEKRIDIRIICATHQDLELMVKKKHFRQDLFYRVNVFQINLPALRERKEDILLLARHFMNSNAAVGKSQVKLDPLAEQILLQYDWPGNIRELKNAVEFACNMSTDARILPEHLPRRVLDQTGQVISAARSGTLAQRVRDFERQIIGQMLGEFGDTTEGKKAAAAALGISIASLYRKL